MTSRRTLEEHLPGLLQRAVPQPPRDVDGASIRARTIAAAAPTGARNRRTSRRLAPLAAAAVVLAFAVVLALVSVQRTSRHAGATDHLGTLDAHTINIRRRAATVTAMQHLLDAFPVPSTWHPSTQSQSKDRTSPSHETGTYVVSRKRRWVTTEAANTSMAYVASHLPPDVVAENSEDPTANSTADFASALFTPTGRRAHSTTYAGTEISVVIERRHSGAVGVDIEASAYWLPVRTPAQTIPDVVTGATVVISSAITRKDYRARIDASDARTLADAINGLAVTFQSVGDMCPQIGPSATLTFAGPDGPQRVTVTPFCPSGVFVRSRTSSMSIDLVPGRIYSTVLAMLDLPPHFVPR